MDGGVYTMPIVSATFNGEALEEFLVDRVQELLLSPRSRRWCGQRSRSRVEAVEFAEEISAVEMAGGEGVDHLLDLDGDDVAAGELGVGEDRTEKPRK